MALGLLRALTSRAAACPRDVSMVGFDDIPEAEFFTPPLTTVRQDFSEMGRRGAAPAARGDRLAAALRHARDRARVAGRAREHARRPR